MSQTKHIFGQSMTEYITFDIEGKEEEIENPDDAILLLSIGDDKNRMDYFITEGNLKNAQNRFPDSIECNNNQLKMLKTVYQIITGTYLKPVDTDCLESEF